jgi:hypothetical protein
MKNTQTSARGFCEEFSTHIYEDKIHNSILVNIDQEWFPTLDLGLRKRGYKLIHVTEMPKTNTCVYQKA